MKRSVTADITFFFSLYLKHFDLACINMMQLCKSSDLILSDVSLITPYSSYSYTRVSLLSLQASTFHEVI